MILLMMLPNTDGDSESDYRDTDDDDDLIPDCMMRILMGMEILLMMIWMQMVFRII